MSAYPGNGCRTAWSRHVYGGQAAKASFVVFCTSSLSNALDEVVEFVDRNDLRGLPLRNDLPDDVLGILRRGAPGVMDILVPPSEELCCAINQVVEVRSSFTAIIDVLLNDGTQDGKASMEGLRREIHDAAEVGIDMQPKPREVPRD